MSVLLPVFVIRRGGMPRGTWQPLRARHLRSARQVEEALLTGAPTALWLVGDEPGARWIRRGLAIVPVARRRRALWLLHASPPANLDVYQAGFTWVLPAPRAALTPVEIAAVLETEWPEDYCIAADHNEGEDRLTVWRGDFTQVVVPLAVYLPPKTRADEGPDRLAVTDYGQTIAYGDYEVSVDALLYDRDPEYRRRANARRIDQDDSFGGCLRRLRRLRRVPRHGFPGLSAKTIARIERGEVARPHRQTLRTIAETLDVEPDEIEQY